MRNRKSGETSSASMARWMPLSKSAARAAALLVEREQRLRRRRPSPGAGTRGARASSESSARRPVLPARSVGMARRKSSRGSAVSPRPVGSYGPPMISCLTSGVPPGTSNRFTRAPFNRRSTGVRHLRHAAAAAAGAAAARAGPSLSTFRFSRGDVTPTHAVRPSPGRAPGTDRSPARSRRSAGHRECES